MNNDEVSRSISTVARVFAFREGPSALADDLEEAAGRVAILDVPLELFQRVRERSRDAEALDQTLRTFFGDLVRDAVLILRETIITGNSSFRRRVLSDFSPSIVELLRLDSLDAPTVLALRERFGVRNVAALERACKEEFFSRSQIFPPDWELDVLDDIYSLRETDAFAEENKGKPSDAAFFKSLDEPPFAIDDENVLFSANADAVADYIVSTLNNPPKSYVEMVSGKSAVNVAKSPSNGVFEGVRDRALGSLKRFSRFFVDRNDPKYARLRREEENLRRRAKEKNAEKEDSNKPAWSRLEKVGSVRRLSDATTRLDFLLETDDPTRAFERIAKADFIDVVWIENPRCLAATLRKTAVVLPYNDRPTPELELRFHVATELTFGTRRLAATCAPTHWNALKERAASRGWTLTAFGLYDGARRVTSRTEERLYEALRLPPIPPELRENRVEWDWIEDGTPPLLTLEDLRGDLHMHSKFTDGTGKIEEMVARARSHGLDYIALTDHTKNVGSVGGMNDSDFLYYWDYIDALNEKMGREPDKYGVFRVLKGAEVDILEGGGLDLTDETLARADWIVASIHFGLEQSAAQIERRYSDAFANPFVDAIAHPTERMIGMRAPMAVDVDFLVESAARSGKFLELNSQPRRLDLPFEGLVAAKKAGVGIVISTDAHSPEQLKYLKFGVEQARRAGLTRNDVVNAASFGELRRRLAERRANVGR